MSDTHDEQAAAADLAHELRGHLAPVVGYAEELGEYLRKRELLDDTADRLADGLVRSARLLRRLLQDVLDCSRDGQGKPVSLPLAPIVECALAWARVRHVDEGGSCDGVECRVDIPAGLVVLGRPLPLSRALANVLVNAYQAMDAGGVLRVEASQREGVTVVRVHDTGVGMNPAVLTSAVRRFVTSRPGSGTGLGLPIAKRIVEVGHGGLFSIVSCEGLGTTVTLRLPHVRRES